MEREGTPAVQLCAPGPSPCLRPDAAQAAGYNLLISTWVYIWLPARLQPCLQRGLGTKLTLEEGEVCARPSLMERRDPGWGDGLGVAFRIGRDASLGLSALQEGSEAPCVQET